MMTNHLIEHARAMISAALAQSRANGARSISALYLTIYPSPDASLDTIRAAIDFARRGTAAEAARVHFHQAAARYICWNCCGLRFEGMDGVCPNCESEALLIPEDIVFELDHIEA
jgi:Zn finger protein HypA/HybF involved in hydrogenase expression